MPEINDTTTPGAIYDLWELELKSGVTVEYIYPIEYMDAEGNYWTGAAENSDPLQWRRISNSGIVLGTLKIEGNKIRFYVQNCLGTLELTTNEWDFRFSNGADMDINLPFKLSWSCLARGTYIIVEERDEKTGKKRRRRKRIEDIGYDDDIVVWDFDNGKFTTAKALWLAKKQDTLQYDILKFSDGTELKTIGQHRIFNKEQGKFTYPLAKETPIGTTTINSNGEEVKLVSIETVYEHIEYYNIVTEYHMNAFANGILTSCRLSNLYPIKDMKYVKDNREIVDKENYESIPQEYYYGLRLGEQPQDINRDNADFHGNTIVEYVRNMIKIAKERK